MHKDDSEMLEKDDVAANDDSQGVHDSIAMMTYDLTMPKNLLIDSNSSPVWRLVSYLNTDICKFELSQNDESRA